MNRKKQIGAFGVVFFLLLAAAVIYNNKKEPELSRYTASFLDVFDTKTDVIGYSTDEEAFAEQVSLLKDKLSYYNDLYDICLHPDITKYNGMHLSEFDSRNLVPSLSINIMQLTLDSLGVALFESDKELMENYKYNHLAGNNGKMLGGDKIINSVK